MNEKDLSQDVELLVWAKYLSESTNRSLQFIVIYLKRWIYEEPQISNPSEFGVSDISGAEWQEAIPLASCLRVSSHPILQQLAEVFFEILDSITLELIEIKNTWNLQNTKEAENEVHVTRIAVQDVTPF